MSAESCGFASVYESREPGPAPRHAVDIECERQYWRGHMRQRLVRIRMRCDNGQGPRTIHGFGNPAAEARAGKIGERGGDLTAQRAIDIEARDERLEPRIGAAYGETVLLVARIGFRAAHPGALVGDRGTEREAATQRTRPRGAHDAAGG